MLFASKPVQDSSISRTYTHTHAHRACIPGMLVQLGSVTGRFDYRVSCLCPWRGGRGVILGGFWCAQLCLTRRLACSACTDVPFQYVEEEAEEKKKFKLLWESWLQKLILLSIVYKNKYIGHYGENSQLYGKIMYVIECNMLNTLAFGTSFRISSGHVVIFIVWENGRGFKCPQGQYFRALTGSIGNLQCQQLLEISFRAVSSHKLRSLEAIYSFITFCSKRISVLW